MSFYKKSWLNDFESAINKDWVGFQNPMSLEITEPTRCKVYISACVKFNKNSDLKGSTKHHGSLYYKILVNGETVNVYHVSDPLYHKKSMGINLHAATDVSAGNTIVEVQYKLSKNGSWTLLNNQGKRELNVMSIQLD